jgi:hypothetical protein
VLWTWLLVLLAALHLQLVRVTHKLPHFCKVICTFKVEGSQTSQPCKQKQQNLIG